MFLCAHVQITEVAVHETCQLCSHLSHANCVWQVSKPMWFCVRSALPRWKVWCVFWEGKSLTHTHTPHFCVLCKEKERDTSTRADLVGVGALTLFHHDICHKPPLRLKQRFNQSFNNMSNLNSGHIFSLSRSLFTAVAAMHVHMGRQTCTYSTDATRTIKLQAARHATLSKLGAHRHGRPVSSCPLCELILLWAYTNLCSQRRGWAVQNSVSNVAQNLTECHTSRPRYLRIYMWVCLHR